VTEALVDDLLAFASIPAPTFAEDERLAWLERRLRRLRGSVTRDAIGNLVWQLARGSPRLLLLVHVDTVFPATTPLRFELRDGRLVGPGIGDNAAAVVTVLDVIGRSPLADDAPVAVAFTVGEEGLGNLRGAHEACERLRPACAIAIEGHGLEHVLVDAVGSMRLRVSVTGPGGHSWENRGRPSAVHALLQLGAPLVQLSSRDSPVNVGTISGGQSVNTIAAEAELVVEMRSLEGASLEHFAEGVRRLEVEAPLVVSVEEVGHRPTGRLDRADPLLASVREVRKRLGLPERLGAGSSDANAALARGIPALTLGVARGGLMHSVDEWLEVGSLELGRRQLEEVVLCLAVDA
jgi:acetylornithine deacetylase/succinyl-diaminopimelate desuccinylase-like protein